MNFDRDINARVKENPLAKDGSLTASFIKSEFLAFYKRISTPLTAINLLQRFEAGADC